MKKRLKAVLAAVGLVAVTLPAGLIGVSPASAETCTHNNYQYNRYINGGESHYTIKCDAGYVVVEGWAKDTKADGKCVYVAVEMNRVISGGKQVSEWRYSNDACPKGDVVNFKFRSTKPTSSAWVYTRAN